jgi:hypothetical protein
LFLGAVGFLVCSPYQPRKKEEDEQKDFHGDKRLEGGSTFAN